MAASREKIRRPVRNLRMRQHFVNVGLLCDVSESMSKRVQELAKEYRIQALKTELREVRAHIGNELRDLTNEVQEQSGNLRTRMDRLKHSVLEACLQGMAEFVLRMRKEAEPTQEQTDRSDLERWIKLELERMARRRENSGRRSPQRRAAIRPSARMGGKEGTRTDCGRDRGRQTLLRTLGSSTKLRGRSGRHEFPILTAA